MENSFQSRRNVERVLILLPSPEWHQSLKFTGSFKILATKEAAITLAKTSQLSRKDTGNLF